jgi:hypothetical protein
VEGNVIQIVCETDGKFGVVGPGHGLAVTFAIWCVQNRLVEIVSLIENRMSVIGNWSFTEIIWESSSFKSTSEKIDWIDVG